MGFVGSAVNIKKCMKQKLLHILVTAILNEPVGTINLSIIILYKYQGYCLYTKILAKLYLLCSYK